MAKTDKVAEFLKSDIGRMNAERFIKALKDGRIVCSVKRVSSSGMSRVIAVREMVKLKDVKRYTLYQFDWFIQQMGWSEDKQTGATKVNGCGMDMVFHLLYTVAHNLEYYGFKLPKNWTNLCDNYHLI